MMNVLMRCLAFEPVEEVIDARTADGHLEGGWWIGLDKESATSLLYYTLDGIRVDDAATGDPEELLWIEFLADDVQ